MSPKAPLPSPEASVSASEVPKFPAQTAERSAASARSPSADPRAKRQARDARRSVDWRALFRAADSREVLTRLMHDDPLGLRARVATRLAHRAWLIDVDRVLLRSFARTARAALGYRGDPSLDSWLDERIDEAMADLLAEDHEAERAGAPLEARHAAVLTTLGGPLGLSPGELRTACVLFNRLPHGDRRAFYALVIQARTLDELAHERSESASDVARGARRGLEALLHGANARRQPPPPGRS